MKFSKKDMMILGIPVLIMLTLAFTPILPDRIPMQFDLKGNVNWYLDKKYSFLLGLLPYIIYKSYRLKHNKR